MNQKLTAVTYDNGLRLVTVFVMANWDGEKARISFNDLPNTYPEFGTVRILG